MARHSESTHTCENKSQPRLDCNYHYYRRRPVFRLCNLLNSSSVGPQFHDARGEP